MTLTKKLVTVFGGTGNQGSAVVRSLLANKHHAFQVRVITRDPTSPRAQQLAQLDVELVQADGWRKNEVVAAFQGSWGAFINSDSDVHGQELDAPNPYDLDLAVLQAADEAAVQHIVYSSAGNTHRATNGRIHISGFDCKSLAEEDFRAHCRCATFTPVLPASFMECWMDESFCRTWGGFPWYPNEQGQLVLSTPPYGGDGRMPWVSVQDDFGDIVHGIFLDPVRYNQKRVQAISQLISYEELAKVVSKATGTEVCFQPLASWSDIPQDGSHCRAESQLIFFYMNFCGGRWFSAYSSDITAAKECKQAAAEARGDEEPKLVTFEEWFKKQIAGAARS